ncbi:hypothetical protein L1267_19055 [Pseudoalteromonas sp. OFAV1]|jgi:hypothetical protein|uniref:hypothetical protein n=1 Tax=Pseudoalteromonas sp. OFAV1 TaxID=2908892 RepID=UPI001F1D6D52|nr:hypothetical protein [Pseudoalteromonas sp. OFAV1]MCF2902473.1 hypothetical protein [Pseudoalteromonas sp. OFAV1]
MIHNEIATEQRDYLGQLFLRTYCLDFARDDIEQILSFIPMKRKDKSVIRIKLNGHGTHYILEVPNVNIMALPVNSFKTNAVSINQGSITISLANMVMDTVRDIDTILRACDYLKLKSNEHKSILSTYNKMFKTH